MTSYIIQILNCQKCKTKFAFWDVGSCNTIDAIFFTDGSILGPMYDPGQLLIECPNCDHVFWSDEKKVVLEQPDWEYFEDKKKSKIKSSRRVNYMVAVVNELWRTNLEEKAIRIRGWQEYNNTPLCGKETQNETNGKHWELSATSLSPKKMADYDNAPDLETLIDMMSNDEDLHRIYMLQISKLHQVIGYDNDTNLTTLIKILDENNENEILLKAEAYRHLGLFSKTIKLIEKKTLSSHLDIWEKTLIKLAQNKKLKREPLARM
ncbi:MAG: hypothetical protein K8S18_01965 [Desulfobacula sp.]|nr:hypothetical protein [Desulfobacula sp.]